VQALEQWEHQAGCKYVVILDYDVTEIDPDTEYDPLILGHRPIAFGHRPLHRDRAGDGFNQAGELNQDAISRGLHNATLMLGDFRIDQFAALCSEPGQKPGLVLAHQPAVPSHIGREDSGEAALDPLFAHPVASPKRNAL
jgi:hypothetical protein